MGDEARYLSARATGPPQENGPWPHGITRKAESAWYLFGSRRRTKPVSTHGPTHYDF